MERKSTLPKRDSDLLRTWRLLYQAKMLIKRVREKERRGSGITGVQLGVMHAVKSIGWETTPAKISRFLGLQPNTVSGTLIKMKQNGLIKKTKDLKKKHHIRVSITEKGEQVFAANQNSESIHRMFKFLSNDENEKLQSQLKMLSRNAIKELELDMDIHKILTEHLADL